MTPRRACRRSCRGQLALPILLAFGLLGIAAISLGTLRVIRVDREAIVRRDLAAIGIAVAGDGVPGGFLGDFGRLPAHNRNDDPIADDPPGMSLERELLLQRRGNDSGTLPAFETGQGSLGGGWRGPYLQVSPRGPNDRTGLLDPWGQPYRVREVAGRVVISSSGADREVGTGDDLVRDAGRARGSVHVRVQRRSGASLTDVSPAECRVRLWVTCDRPPCGSFDQCEGPLCWRRTSRNIVVATGFYTWTAGSGFQFEPGILHRGSHWVDVEGVGGLTGYSGAARVAVSSDGEPLRIVITPGGT